jgi:transketolase
MAEGSVWWALDKAAHYRLGNLTAIVDVNQRGLTELDRTWTPADAALRRSAAPRAWWTDRTSPRSTWRWLPPRQAGGPAVVLAKTAKGKGSPEIEDQNGWHGRVRAAAGPAVRGARPARLRHPDELMEPAGYHRAPDRSGPPAA